MKRSKRTCDFLVVGGGLPGIAAAVCAGRLGLKTVLAEKEMLLGGNAGPNLGVGAHAAMSTNPYFNETGIVEEIEEAVSFHGARLHPTHFGYNIHPMWDDVVAGMLADAGVTVLRRHLAVSAAREGRRIERVVLKDLETLDEVHVETAAGYVLDCSGDAFVADMAGASWRSGREARGETGERCAPDRADGVISAASLTALVVDTGRPCAFVPPPGTPEWNPAKPDSHFDPTRKIHFLWQVDEGGESDENNSLFTPQALYKKLAGRIYSLWNYLKNVKYPAETACHQLAWISPILGRREGRRVECGYMLTQTDIESARRFDDAIGFGGAYLDEHLPSRDGGYEVRFYSRPYPYDIPFRCIYSRDVDNLFVGGRAVGATHLAFTSLRLMRTGAALSQAAAVAAKLCIDKGLPPAKLSAGHVRELQQALIRTDGWILGVPGDGADDVARSARASASSCATLSRDPGQGEYLDAGAGVFALIYDYPESIDAFSFYVRNLGGAAEVEAVWGYAETPPIRYLPVPRRAPGPEAGGRGEARAGGRVLSVPEGLIQVTGSEGCEEFYVRADSIDAFDELGRVGARVEPGFEGFVAFRAPRALVLPAKDRSKWGQAAVIGIAGPVEALVAPHPVDVVEGLIAGKNDLYRVPVFKTTPEILPGSPEKLLDGHIHRMGRWDLHQWMSDPRLALPQWVEFDFEEPAAIERVELVFDVTERLWKDMYLHTGARAAARLVKRYVLEAFSGGQWRAVAQDDMNYRRFVSKRIAPVSAQKLRLTVLEVWGEGQAARVYQVRAYGRA